MRHETFTGIFSSKRVNTNARVDKSDQRKEFTLMRRLFVRLLNPIAVFLLTLITAAWIFAACSPYADPHPPFADTRAAKQLIERLNDDGAQIRIGGEVSSRYLSVKGNMLMLDGAQVQFFEYASAAAALADAARFAPDALTIHMDGIAQVIDWLATPHLYLHDTLIVLYVGDDVNTIERLNAALGSRYAGGANPYSIAYTPIAE